MVKKKMDQTLNQFGWKLTIGKIRKIETIIQETKYFQKLLPLLKKEKWIILSYMRTKDSYANEELQIRDVSIGLYKTPQNIKISYNKVSKEYLLFLGFGLVLQTAHIKKIKHILKELLDIE